MLSVGRNAETGVLGVGVHQLGPETMSAIVAHLDKGGRLACLLRVAIDPAQTSPAEPVPSIAGRHRLTASGIHFVPHFPFQPQLCYRATFDPAPLGRPELSPGQTLDFILPADKSTSPTKVAHIYPSHDELPENLLRFYIRFSSPMERGRAETEISVLESDGSPAADVLYRPPVELWDSTMQVLTVLLDPGRLKRSVGPNRALGPPLAVGQSYTLLVGAGMTDRFGRTLDKPASKRFRVSKALRQPIAIDQWGVTAPAAGSCEPLVLGFPAPLDWAMLFNSISVATQSGDTIDGQIDVGLAEQRWSFTPDTPWAPGDHHIWVDPGLEDPSGNNLSAAFDRPLRATNDMSRQVGLHSIPFRPIAGCQSRG